MTRIASGLPRTRRAMVMAETQRSPESVRSAERLRARRIRQDSAACVSLSSIHLSKSARGETVTQTGPACAAPSRRKRGLSPGRPREASYPIRRLPAHCRAPVHGARATLINLNRRPCQQLIKNFLLAAHHEQRARCPKSARIATHTSCGLRRRHCGNRALLLTPAC